MHALIKKYANYFSSLHINEMSIYIYIHLQNILCLRSFEMALELQYELTGPNGTVTAV